MFRIHGCYSEIDLDLKLLLKRGALLTIANWQTVAIQFVAQTTFQVLLAVPIIGAAILVAVLLGGDMGNLLQGSMREMFATVADALTSEPVALLAFVAAFGLVLVGGSVFMFLVKGGTMSVLLDANDVTGPIESEPITYESVKQAAQFSMPRFVHGCTRLFRPYLYLGLALIVVYALSGAGYLAFVVYGYQAAGDQVLLIGWTFIAALSAVALVLWITLVNLVYLLLQIAIAIEGVGLGRRRALGGGVRARAGTRARRGLSRRARAGRRGHARIGAGLVGCRPHRVRAARRPGRLPAADRRAADSRIAVRVHRPDRPRRVSHPLSPPCPDARRRTGRALSSQ